VNVEAFLDSMAKRGASEALVAEGTSYSYAELVSAIEEAWQFRDVRPGSVVALVGGFDLPTISALFALWRRDCVVVPMLADDKKRCEIAQVEIVVQEARPRETGILAKHPLYADISGPGLVLFTSGSTGVPKAAVHNVARWFDKLSRPGRRQRTLAFLSFDHIGGLNTLLYAFANGGCLVCPPDRSPACVWETIARHEVELLPTTPTFLRLALLDGAVTPLPSLRLVAYGSEPMPQATLDAAKAALPNVEFLQQYGMSELGVLRSRSREDGSTWVRLGGKEFDVRVVDGLLEVRADTAMVGYLNAPSPFTEDGWLRTGDEAEQDGEWLRIRGRRSETINVGGEKVHPAEVESFLESLPGVAQAVVHGEANPILGQVVVASVRLTTDEPLEAFRARARTELRGKLPRYAIPQRIEPLANAPTVCGKKVRTPLLVDDPRPALPQVGGSIAQAA
jgi:acyl-CoA synthetase (AMP-forming)/AMP-acid ligase II